MESGRSVRIALNILSVGALLLMIVAMATPGWVVFSLDLGEEKLDIGVNPYYISATACTTDTYMGSTSTECVSKEYDLDTYDGIFYCIINTILYFTDILEFSSNNHNLNDNTKSASSFKSSDLLVIR